MIKLKKFRVTYNKHRNKYRPEYYYRWHWYNLFDWSHDGQIEYNTAKEANEAIDVFKQKQEDDQWSVIK
jgi:hypothetical protein